MAKRYFLTDDTALAAYLYLRGYKFIEATVWAEVSSRKKYVIYDSPLREEDEQDFYLRRTAVAPMDYHDARVAVSKFLKRQIRDPRFPEL